LRPGGANNLYSKHIKDVKPFVADARRDDGKRFAVRTDEKLTAFLELEGLGLTRVRLSPR
jgi:hypothetical protein